MSRERATSARLSGTRPAGTHDEAAASRQVREMFSRIAPRYDLLNHLLSLRFDVMWRKRLTRRFAPILARPQSRVLDVCCGTGDLALALANARLTSDASEPAPLVGADFAQPMLARAREKAADATVATIAARSNSSKRMRCRFLLPMAHSIWWPPRLDFATWQTMRRDSRSSVAFSRRAARLPFSNSPSRGARFSAISSASISTACFPPSAPWFPATRRRIAICRSRWRAFPLLASLPN